MRKQKSRAFGKDVYLLGADSKGVKYWLEAPKWECEWYWACGYVKTYTNNDSPGFSSDILTMQHFDGLFFEKKVNCYLSFTEFFKDMTVSEKEIWKLLELMKTVYVLKETAEVLGRGGSHISENLCKDIILDMDEVKRINETILPALFTEIEKILTQ